MSRRWLLVCVMCMCLGVGENSSQMQAIVKKDDPLIEHAHISCTAYVEMFVMNKLYYGLYQNLKITYATWISMQCMSHTILSCEIKTVINLCGKLIQSYCEISSLWKFQHIWYTVIIRTSTTNHEHSGLSMQHHKYTRLLTLLFWTPLCVESRGSFLAVTRGKWSCHSGLREVPACVEDDNLYLME